MDKIIFSKAKHSQVLLAIIFATLSSIAFLFPTIIPEWEDVVSVAGGSDGIIGTTMAKLLMLSTDTHISGAIIVVTLSFLYLHEIISLDITIYKNYKVVFLASLFSLLTLLGRSFETFDTLDFIIGNTFQFIYSIILFMGYLPFYLVVIKKVFTLYDYLKNRNIRYMDNEDKKRMAFYFVDKKPFLIPFIVCIIAWLPYWIMEFPGTVVYDIMWQFDIYFGVYPWSNHHPILSTLVFGTLLSIGRTIHSDNLGIAICVVFQMVSLATAAAYTMKVIKKWNISSKIRFVVLIFFAFNPIFGFLIRALGKDCIAVALILIFSVQVLEIIRRIRINDVSNSTNRLLFACCVIGVLSTQFRHNNLYVIVITFIGFMLLKQTLKERIKYLIAAISCLIFATIISTSLTVFFDATEGSKAEMLSIPFQQTARYVRDYDNEITLHEKEVINSVLDYETIGQNYNSKISDPVKATYKSDDKKLPQYFNIWYTMLLKHPLTYVEAFLGGTYLYYYPFGSIPFGLAYPNAMESNPIINTGFFDFYYLVSEPYVRMISWNFLYWISHIPGISIIFHPGTYTWLLMISALYLKLKKKSHMIVGMIPAIISFLSCIASPLNGSIRYSLPIIITTPIIILYCIYISKDCEG